MQQISVTAGTSIQRVIAGAAGQRISAVPAIDQIIATTAIKPVIAMSGITKDPYAFGFNGKKPHDGGWGLQPIG